jgi:hypothetical protein
MAWSQLKSQVSTKTNVQSIDLSFWSTFPMVSIEMTDFYVEGKSTRQDTLLFAHQVYLSFDVWDAWNGKYEINRMRVEDGKLYLKEDSKGGQNWKVMKEELNAQDSLPIHLHKLSLRDVDAIYRNERSGYNQHFWIKSLILKGDFSQNEIQMNVDFSGNSRYVVVQDRPWLKGQEIGLKGEVLYNRQEERIEFNKTDVTIVESGLHLNGWVNFKQGNCDAELESDEMRARDVLNMMPDFFRTMVSQYEPEGSLSLNATCKGDFSDLNVLAQMNWRDGSLMEPMSSLSMDNVEMQMKYGINGKKDWVELTKLNAKLGGGQLSLNGRLENLKNPEVKLHLSMDGQLEDLKEYFKWDTLETAQGTLKLEADLGGNASLLSDSTFDWRKLNAQGNLMVSEGNLKVKGSEHSIRDLYTVVQLLDQSAIIQQLKCNVGSNDFDITGKLQNLIPYWFSSDEVLRPEIELMSSHLVLSEFINANEKSEFAFFLPRVEWVGHCKIGRMTHDPFAAKDLELDVEGNDHGLNLKKVRMNLAQGTVDGNAQIFMAEEGNWRFISNLNLSEIEIKELFQSFNNFGQNVVTADQIQGKLFSNVEVALDFDPQFHVIRPSIEFVADITLSNGSIQHLKWLNDVGEYIQKNRWIAPLVDEDLLAQRMSNVQFSQLKNVISMQNEVLEIPWMEINTSAFNMVMRASHHLNVNLDYLFGIQIGDLLLRDPNQKPKEDGKKLYIQMKGPSDALVFSVEKEPADMDWNAQDELERERWLDKMKSKFKKNGAGWVNNRKSESGVPDSGQGRRVKMKRKKTSKRRG